MAATNKCLAQSNKTRTGQCDEEAEDRIGSLCNANVSLTDPIKGWFVALAKQLNA